MNLDRFAFTSCGVKVTHDPIMLAAIPDVISELNEVDVKGERARRESGFFVADLPELIAGRDDDVGTLQHNFACEYPQRCRSALRPQPRRRG